MAKNKARSGSGVSTEITKLIVQLTRTSDGHADYIQIMSSDMLTVNVVLIAATIEVRDDRLKS